MRLAASDSSTYGYGIDHTIIEGRYITPAQVFGDIDQLGNIGIFLAGIGILLLGCGLMWFITIYSENIKSKRKEGKYLSSIISF